MRELEENGDWTPLGLFSLACCPMAALKPEAPGQQPRDQPSIK